MATFIKTVGVELGLLYRLTGLLMRDKIVPDADPAEVFHTITVQMGMYEIDIKICNGEGGPWIDAVIFDHGCEIYALEPGFSSLLGDYIFYVDGDEYWLILERMDDYGDNYVLKPDHYAWIEADILTVHVKHQGGAGVVVDIYPLGMEDQDTLLGTTWVDFHDAMGYLEGKSCHTVPCPVTDG